MPDKPHAGAIKAARKTIVYLYEKNALRFQFTDTNLHALATIIAQHCPSAASQVEALAAWREVARELASALSCLEWHHDDPGPYCASCNTHSKTMQHRKGCHVGDAMSKYRAVCAAHAALSGEAT